MATGFDIKPVIQAIESFVAQNGYQGKVGVGEPKSPPAEEIAAAVFLRSLSVIDATLTTLDGHAMVTIRLYRDMLAEPTEDNEYKLAAAAFQLLADVAAGFTLSGLVRHVDFAGAGGNTLVVQFGYTDIGGRLFRIADIDMPMIINDIATLTA